MRKLFLSPEGRLSSQDFLHAGMSLILIGVIPNLIALVNFNLAQKFNWISFLVLWPWVAIWVKRLHEGGKSGWMFLVYLLLYLLLSIAAMMVVIDIFSGDAFWKMMADMANGALSQTEMELQMQVWSKTMLLPTTIVSLITSLAALYIGDKTIGIDPHDNQYGPGSDQASVFE